ncbi:MAG TPA: stage V sporulation protein AE [Syntrophomonadaceae bacterium]|nr:stage V sporulation protein AE [Syntrophomonadaceae bacterium]
MIKAVPVRIIIVTDGDASAQQAVETAALKLGLYPLMATGGNPTHLSSSETLKYIFEAPYDPVVVMADDRGKKGMGPGERIMEQLLHHPCLQVLGVVAVASDTRVRGVAVDKSVTIDVKTVEGPVDKHGYEEIKKHHRLEGDTVEILRHYPDLFIIGCGDLGKMDGRDSVKHGACITEQCFREILKHAEDFI